jgi:hypothetical protein
MKRLFAAFAVLAGLLTFAGFPAAQSAAAGAPSNPIVYQCHNDSHMANNFTGHGTRFPQDHRDDPNVGLTGAVANPEHMTHADGGYYYLDVVACGTTVHVTVTKGCWGYTFGSGLNAVVGTEIYQAPIMTAVDLTYTHAVPGTTYYMRVQNLDPTVSTDVSTIDSPAGS